jgi:hypothetical protein
METVTPASLLRTTPAPCSQGRNPLSEIIAMLEKAQSQGFYGQIQIDFQNGAITIIRRTETIKVTSNNGKETLRPHDTRYNR